MNGRIFAFLSLLGWTAYLANGFTVPITRSLPSHNFGNGQRQSVYSVVSKSSENDDSNDTSSTEKPGKGGSILEWFSRLIGKVSGESSETEETQSEAEPTEEVNDEPVIISTSDVVKKVAVTGATGKTGQLVVEELLSRNVQVIGLVRNETKAAELFGSLSSDMLEIQECNLSDPAAIGKAVDSCDATIWCATGFSDAPTPGTPPTATMSADQSIDVIGVPALATTMLEKHGPSEGEQSLPKVVMLSSAGVTRPSWDDEKKERLNGCADIPIVRLNPFGILGLKAESEKQLRESGVDYCIVRPCGLNDNWPEGARPVFSQGDVAVGRINRKDVAKVLCDVLSLPESCNKTFEVIGLGGYPAPRTIGPALERLKLDSESLSEFEVEAMYAVAQQLLPGERQDAAALAMGQTYEQLDKGETGRLGERGKENVGAAGIKPTTPA